jgi:C1A family cysteine protease
MRIILQQLFFLSVGVIAAIPDQDTQSTLLSIIDENNTNIDYWKSFLSFQKRFNKIYTSETELQQRFEIFKENVITIFQHNLEKKENYTMGINQFTDLTSTEFDKNVIHGGFIGSTSSLRGKSKCSQYSYQQLKVPSSIDWRELGAVTPVKDQGQCGSCWSFSTTGALESAYFNKYGTLVSFSEQQLVDCDNLQNGGRDHGCNGGLMDNAFSWIQKNGGLCSEKDYPYVSGSTKTAGTCSKTCKVDSNSKVQKFVDVSPNSDDEMMTALTKQTVSVAIEADQPAFQLYKSGVFTGSCGTTLDHGVLVVGYGKEGSLDYYTVKNSWGTTWGLNGYIKLGRGPSYNNGKGQCGVLMEASYPVL